MKQKYKNYLVIAGQHRLAGKAIQLIVFKNQMETVNKRLDCFVLSPSQ